MKKSGSPCNCRPPHNVNIHKPKFFPPYDMDYHRPHPCPKHEVETIVKCGSGMTPGPLCSNNIGTGDGGCKHQSPVIANVALDTGKLQDPTVKIDFSSLISFKACGYGSYFLRLVFKLSKACDGGIPLELGNWTFEKSKCYSRSAGESFSSEEGFGDSPDGDCQSAYHVFEHVQETDSFCFTWCQCDDCPGCCNYIVELVDQDCYNIDFAIIRNIVITGIANGIKK